MKEVDKTLSPESDLGCVLHAAGKALRSESDVVCVWHAVDKAQVGQRQEHAAEHAEVHAESACANSMRQEHAGDRMQAFFDHAGNQRTSSRIRERSRMRVACGGLHGVK